jgi:hypothetical protein
MTLSRRVFASLSRSILLSLVLCCPIFFAACGDSRPEASQLQAEEAMKNLDSLSRTLGSGFDSARNKKLANCMDASKFNYSGSNYSDLSFVSDASYEDLLDELSVGVYGKASLFGLASAKVSGDVIHTLATTDQTGAFIYKFEVSGKSAVLAEPRLNDHGMAAHAKNDPNYFRNTCGDQFVEQAKLGAKLFIGLKYTFTSKEDKDKLLLKLNGSLLWGLIKFSKEWSEETRSLLKNVRVSVEAFQLGGDTRRLEELKMAIYQGSCAGDNAENCAQSLDRLMQYGREDFANQLNNMAVSEDPFQGPAILSVSTKAYSAQKIYSKDKKSLYSIPVDDSVTLASSVLDALVSLHSLDSRVKTELERNSALRGFSLTASEEANLSVSTNDLKGLESLIPPLRELCSKSLDDDSKAKTCSAKVGELKNKADRMIRPVSLSPR